MHVLRRNKKIYVSKEQLLDMVFRAFSEDISDPEGITDRIETEKKADSDEDFESDDDEEEEKKDENELDTNHRRNVSADDTLNPVRNLKHTHAAGIMSQRSLIKRRESLIDEDDQKTAASEKIKSQRQKMAAARMELFHKDEITASAVKMEVESMFNKLQNRRKLKITETTIDYYRRKGLKHVRLLQDDETLRYIFEQLSRYIIQSAGI